MGGGSKHSLVTVEKITSSMGICASQVHDSVKYSDKLLPGTFYHSILLKVSDLPFLFLVV